MNIPDTVKNILTNFYSRDMVQVAQEILVMDTDGPMMKRTNVHLLRMNVSVFLEILVLEDTFQVMEQVSLSGEENDRYVF